MICSDHIALWSSCLSCPQRFRVRNSFLNRTTAFKAKDENHSKKPAEMTLAGLHLPRLEVSNPLATHALAQVFSRQSSRLPNVASKLSLKRGRAVGGPQKMYPGSFPATHMCRGCWATLRDPQSFGTAYENAIPYRTRSQQVMLRGSFDDHTPHSQK